MYFLNNCFVPRVPEAHLEPSQTSTIKLFCRNSERYPLRKKCLYSELFCSAFSHSWTEYGEIRRSISPYLLRMQENANQKTPNTDTFHAVI